MITRKYRHKKNRSSVRRYKKSLRRLQSRQDRQNQKNKKQNLRRYSRLSRRPGRLHRGGASGGSAGGDIPDDALVDVKLEPEDPQSPPVLMSYKQAKEEVFYEDSYI